MSLLLFYFGVLWGCSSALYNSVDDVIQLNPTSWEHMLKSDNLWFVEFFAPWCGHCKQLAPIWVEAAKRLKGLVKVAAIDVDEHRSIGSEYGIKGFPTIKIFGSNKTSPTDYLGARTVNAIVESAMENLSKMVRGRGTSGGGGGEKKSERTGSNVIDLTDDTFDQVYDSEDMWLIGFFAPWCGHCQRLKPEWEKAADELVGKVKVAAVDATVERVVASKFNIRSYPTIKVFPAGSKADLVEDYDGGRSAEDIVRFALDRYVAVQPAPQVVELTNPDLLKSSCESQQICIISFLPHLLDCQSECRNKYLDTLKNAAEKFKRHDWGWLWVEGGKQTHIETAFGVGGFGYPAMTALNYRKKIFASLKGSFGDEGIHDFLLSLSFGRGSTASLPEGQIPNVLATTPWNGEDAQPPEEPEVDLEDLGIKTDL